MIKLTKHGRSGTDIILNESEISSIVETFDSHDNYTVIKMKNNDKFLAREATQEIEDILKKLKNE